MQDTLKKLVEISASIKKLQEVEKILKEKLLADWWDVKDMVDWYNVTTQTRTTYKEKESVDIDYVVKTYPNAVKIDGKKLYEVSENPDELVDVKVSRSVVVKKMTEKQMQKYLDEQIEL